MGFWQNLFAATGGKNKENTHNFNPASRYCPACGDEYRPEISRCAACGLELVTGEERIARLATAARCPRRPEPGNRRE
ncbi:MAG: hypothetical protein LBH14_01025 [Desulfobulbaceae bacterium]|nr:hypothetical protein [Desulfobulbaceae bacterium]